jgi:hypothetical protein
MLKLVLPLTAKIYKISRLGCFGVWSIMYLLWDHHLFNNNNNLISPPSSLRRPNITIQLTPIIVVSVAVMSRTSIQEKVLHSLQYLMHSLSISWFSGPLRASAEMFPWHKSRPPLSRALPSCKFWWCFHLLPRCMTWALETIFKQHLFVICDWVYVVSKGSKLYCLLDYLFLWMSGWMGETSTSQSCVDDAFTLYCCVYCVVSFVDSLELNLQSFKRLQLRLWTCGLWQHVI